MAPTIPATSSNSINGTWSPIVSTAIAGTVIYTFTPNPGQCAATATMSITVNPTPVLVITNPAPVCYPDVVDLTALNVTSGSTGITTLTYWTDPSATTPLGSPSIVGTSGTYFIESTTAFGCVDIEAVTVVIHSLPIATFVPTPNLLTSLNSESTMINNSINAVSYVWDFGDGTGGSTATSPSHDFPADVAGTYQITLIATSIDGCVDKAIENVTVTEELIFYVPNTFTPDHDDFNETFLPIFVTGYDPFDYTLLIFNRWGEIVFESHDAKIGWEGTLGAGGGYVQDGTFTWKIDFKLKEVTERKTVIGHVNIVR